MLIPIKIVIIIFIVLGCNNLDELTYVVVILDMGEDNKPWQYFQYIYIYVIFMF